MQRSLAEIIESQLEAAYPAEVLEASFDEYDALELIKFDFNEKE